jgi:uncharacterized MAPEG superfamily protein
MTTPFWCLLLVVVAPYLLSSAAGAFRIRQFGTLDNKYPRAQEAKLEGLGARVIAAHQNAMEAVPIFASSVLVAHLAGADPEASATASIVFVVARAAHAACYIANLDVLRSAVFLVGLGSCFWLFGLAIHA